MSISVWLRMRVGCTAAEKYLGKRVRRISMESERGYSSVAKGAKRLMLLFYTFIPLY